MIGPKPTYRLTSDEVEENRNLTCIMYSDCLLVASDANWQSFTCKQCSLNKLRFKQEEIIHDPENSNRSPVGYGSGRTAIGAAW